MGVFKSGKMAVGKIDKSAPQDPASKKARAVARAKAAHIRRAALPGAKVRQPTGKKVVTQGKNTVLKVKEEIKVIKRTGGTLKFARDLQTIKKAQKAKIAAGKKVVPAEAKEAKKPKKTIFKTCRMRKVYATQLPMRYAPAKGSTRHVNRTTKLRKTFTPGTVCIIVAGRHRAKKCVFLKQFKRSGLLLVTGPHRYNGVPLRRIDQKHVIATSQKLPLGHSFKVPGHVDDFFFKRARGTKKNVTTKAKDAVLKKSAKKDKKVDLVRRKAQNAIDNAVSKGLKSHPDGKLMRVYMRRLFTLNGDRFAHNLKF